MARTKKVTEVEPKLVLSESQLEAGLEELTFLHSENESTSTEKLVELTVRELLVDDNGFVDAVALAGAKAELTAHWEKHKANTEATEGHDLGEPAVPECPESAETTPAENPADEEVDIFEDKPKKKEWPSSTRREIELAHSKLRSAVKASQERLSFLIFDKQSRNEAKKLIDTRADIVLDACCGVDRHMQILISTINEIENDFPNVPVNEIIARYGMSNQPTDIEQEVLQDRDAKEAEDRLKRERAEKKANKDLDKGIAPTPGQLSIYDELGGGGSAEAASECVTRTLEEGEDVTEPLDADEPEEAVERTFEGPAEVVTTRQVVIE